MAGKTLSEADLQSLLTMPGRLTKEQSLEMAEVVDLLVADQIRWRLFWERVTARMSTISADRWSSVVMRVMAVVERSEGQEPAFGREVGMICRVMMGDDGISLAEGVRQGRYDTADLC
jgi:hypothetical protein